MTEPNEEQDVTIWHLLNEASRHLQNPPPGGWEYPDDVEKSRQLVQKDPSVVHASDGEGNPHDKNTQGF
jgi:hypothetical protein